ncbi:MAG: reverse transcriptase domain-containing protein, partial [Pseudomonadota bacterium]
MPPSTPPDPYRQMAALMLAQGWDRGRMTAALKVACDFDEASVDTLVRNVMADWQQPYPPAEGQLAESLWQLIGDAPPGSDDGDGLRPELPHILAPHTATEPILALSGAAVPKIETRLELADWLDVTPAHLDWFADCAGRLARQGPDHLRHYNELWLRKRSGGKRLVEAPLQKLKRLQRKIQDELLAHLPVHRAAYGFVRGRGCRGHAALHAGEDVVVTLDLKDFFASVQAGRVHAIFRCLGYPAAVARLLTGLVTTQTPPEVLAT